MLKVSVFDIKNEIDDLVTKAFDKVFVRSADCWFEITEIELDYSCNDEPDLFPIVTVVVRYFHKWSSEEVQVLNLRINLEESYDFNLGHLVNAFERQTDDE